VIRTIKEDLLWINEFKTLDELKEALGRRQHDYNHVFPNSLLEYCTPGEYEERWYKRTEPQNTRVKNILRMESLFEPMNQNRELCNVMPPFE
jgi:hypothetical protein